MWLSVAFAAVSLVALLVPRFRRNERVLALASLLVFASLWLEKGMGLIVAGFVPSPLHKVTAYAPTAPEWAIVCGIWAVGALLVTVLYKVTVSIREAQ
jgi:molybdopterin-containing oxidoreductase family membrane subunit